VQSIVIEHLRKRDGSFEQAIFSEFRISRDPTPEADSNSEEGGNQVICVLGCKPRRIDWSDARNNRRAREQLVLHTEKLPGVFEVRESRFRRSRNRKSEVIHVQTMSLPTVCLWTMMVGLRRNSNWDNDWDFPQHISNCRQNWPMSA
jgi:hypothetical protein